MTAALTRRRSIRSGRWRPGYVDQQVHVIDAEVVRGQDEPAFMARLTRHLAWHLVRQFVLKHPLLTAQVGLSAVKEATGFAISEQLKKRRGRKS
jgi:hypothetical protein